MATLDFPLGRFTLLGGDEQVFYQWRSVFPLESTRYAAITTTTYTTTAQMTFGLTFAFSNRSVLLQTKDEGRRTCLFMMYMRLRLSGTSMHIQLEISLSLRCAPATPRRGYCLLCGELGIILFCSPGFCGVGFLLSAFARAFPPRGASIYLSLRKRKNESSKSSEQTRRSSL